MRLCKNCKDELVRHRYPSKDGGRTKGVLETTTAFKNRGYCYKPECRDLVYSTPKAGVRGYPARIPEKQDPFLDCFNFVLLVDIERMI